MHVISHFGIDNKYIAAQILQYGQVMKFRPDLTGMNPHLFSYKLKHILTLRLCHHKLTFPHFMIYQQLDCNVH